MSGLAGSFMVDKGRPYWGLCLIAMAWGRHLRCALARLTASPACLLACWLPYVGSPTEKQIRPRGPSGDEMAWHIGGRACG